jgi:tetratricopeptide (TPR) repeat protein
MSSPVSDPFNQMRERAKSLHQIGELPKAALVYERLLRLQEDADVLGLLALCKFQLGKHDEAFPLWYRALSKKTSSRIAWRNSNNALAAALSSHEKIDVLSLLPQPIPIWDCDAVSTTADISMAQSFMAALERLGRISEIDGLLASFIAQIDVSNEEAITLMQWVLARMRQEPF